MTELILLQLHESLAIKYKFHPRTGYEEGHRSNISVTSEPDKGGWSNTLSGHFNSGKEPVPTD
jgi:hypothetical protein